MFLRTLSSCKEEKYTPLLLKGSEDLAHRLHSRSGSDHNTQIY
jgi:hypothetical protein